MTDTKSENKILWILVVMLFTCGAFLILAMYNSLIFSEFDKNLLNVSSTFFGALAGASIAGYISVKIFERGLQHEHEKNNAELIVKKIIYLNEYLDMSKRLYFQLKQFDLDRMERIKNSSINTTRPLNDETEFEICNLTINLCKDKHSTVFYYVEDAKNKISKVNYDHIMDVEFRICLKNHQQLLDQILDFLDLVNGYKEVTTYGIEFWSVKDLAGLIQRYVSEYDDIEKYFYEYK